MSKKNHSDQSQSFEAQAAQAIKDEAEKIANATQTSGQTKSETRLISQGIAKGIEAYKKQEKAKARERSKNEKKKKTQASVATDSNEKQQSTPDSSGLAKLVKYISNFMALLSFAHFAMVIIPKQTLEENIQWLPIGAVSMGIFYLLTSLMLLKVANRLRK
jgi:hypothetical protein